LDLADRLRREKRDGAERRRLTAKHIALLFEKTSTRTRSAFEVAARDQGGHATYLGPGETQFGVKESTKDTARVLGRFFDGIEFRGFHQSDAEILADFSGVPVWNGLTDRWHPTQSLADLLTMRDHAGRPLDEVSVCFLGDAANNTCASLITAGALMGMDVRVAAPTSRRPAPEVWRDARSLAAVSGGSLTLTDDPREGVEGVDFLYTDVWLSLGEPEELWDERIDLLRPYQVNAALVAATGNPDVKLLHCLPAFHGVETEIGRRIFEKRGLEAMEVTDEVFESAASVVFDEAENRLYTIKAILVATLSGLEV
jgi:ornithine carbamoyltransferase